MWEIGLIIFISHPSSCPSGEINEYNSEAINWRERGLEAKRAIIGNTGYKINVIKSVRPTKAGP